MFFCPSEFEKKNKKEGNERINVKYQEKIGISFLRYCCVLFQVFILEK